MNNNQYKKRRQIREGRLEVIAQLYKRGFTIRAIRAELMKRFDLPTLSTETIHRDIQTLLKEWRESRLENIDDIIQLELARIDDTIIDLWYQWEKSKEDYTKTQRKRKGAPSKANNTENNIQTFSIEEQTQHIKGLGDPTYISEIRHQQIERRKILGLYAPEKRDINSKIEIGFVSTDHQPAESEDEVEI